MAEVALGLGASVVTFLGLAGQTLKGCQYIHDFIGDAKSSSKDLNGFSTEIECLQFAILGLQDLQERMGQSWADGRIDTQVTNAMESGSAVIEDIEKFFRKFEPRTFEWWTGLKLASKRRELAGYYRRLEAAKTQMIITQFRLTRASTLSQGETLQVLTASLQFNTDTTHLYLADLQRTMLALEYLTSNGIKNLQIEMEVMSRLLDELPTRLGSVIQTAISTALQEASTENQSNSQSQASETRDESNPLSLIASRGCYTVSGQFAGSQDIQPLRKIINIVQQRTIFSFYFATMAIQSTRTENWDNKREKVAMVQYP
ncbi:hypothetical protein IFR05_012125 [Cadophora sp. M221]|nr:hypothetical protein IFR05_012125 [Cadophora sp. M221]